MEPKLLHFDIQDPANPGSRCRVACTQWGTPDSGPTVLCAHGLTRNGRDFDYLARSLCEHFHVLCPDMPGRGQSAWLKNPEGYHNTAYVAVVAFILRSFHINRVHWIGTSMGGIMGLLAASGQPGLLKSLTLNDIGCFIPASGLRRIADLADLKTSYKTRAEAEQAYHQRCAAFCITSEAQWQHLFQYGLRVHSSGVTDFTYDPAIFTTGFPKGAPVEDVDLWPLWEPVTQMPVLLIRGMESDILPRETALDMQERHTDLLLHEVEDAGHAPSLMDSREIALIHEWLYAKEVMLQAS